jgi:hypothetical protein
MGTRTTSLALIALMESAIVPAHSAPDAVLYSLQERCGKQAADTFTQEWGSNVANIRGTYENHYNADLNKCFYLETSTIYPNGTTRTENVIMLRLFDLNENKEYATFIKGGAVMTCDVRGIQCSSEDEWLMLTKTYMEN